MRFAPQTLALSLLLLGLSAPASAQRPGAGRQASTPPLLHLPDTGIVPDDPNQSLVPYSVRASGSGGGSAQMGPGLISGIPEYEPCEGVIWRYSASSWAQVVTDCVAAITGDPTTDEICVVVVSSPTQQGYATSDFIAAGADMSRVQFFIAPNNSIWLRDYGPHFVWQDGALAITDSHYYTTRSNDNFVPTLLGEDYFQIPTYHMSLMYSGGNFQPGPNRSGFVTSLINQDNSTFSTQLIEDVYQGYQGIDTLHILPRLPGSVDGTGHIDMWMYLVDEDSVIISEFIPGSNSTAITVTNNAATYMAGLGYTVTRVPAWNSGGTHYTYTNAFRVNDRIFTPKYGPGNSNYLNEDAQALAAWQAAAGPGVEIIPINCYDIIWASGAIHCIMMQIPRYTAPAPSAVVISPAGGELLVPGEVHDLHWGATDDEAVTSVDIAYSTDGGVSFPHVIANGETNDGHYNWTVPLVETTTALVRVIANDLAANSTTALSHADFEITDKTQHVYDFSSGAGVDRWAYGYNASSANIYGNRYPVSSQLSSTNYSRIAAADVSGSSGRYASPTSSSRNVHVFDFEIDEDVADIVDIDLLWKGYASSCRQIDLFVWDGVAGDWSDGRGNYGFEQHVEVYSGNRYDELKGSIRSDFDRYVSGGKLTLLTLTHLNNRASYHDYVSVTVTYDAGPPDPITPYCFGNGSDGVLCPCFNLTSPTDAGGCANSVGLFLGQGAVLSATGTVDVVADDLVLHIDRAIPNEFGIFAQNTAPQAPTVFYDGSFCLAQTASLLRLYPVFQLDAGGSTQSGMSLVGASGGEAVPGATLYYQGWYRDGTGPCGNGANFSNALAVIWQ